MTATSHLAYGWGTEQWVGLALVVGCGTLVTLMRLWGRVKETTPGRYLVDWTWKRHPRKRHPRRRKQTPKSETDAGPDVAEGGDSDHETYWADAPDAPEMVRPYMVYAENRRLMTDATVVLPALAAIDPPAEHMPSLGLAGRHRLHEGSAPSPGL